MLSYALKGARIEPLAIVETSARETFAYQLPKSSAKPCAMGPSVPRPFKKAMFHGQSGKGPTHSPIFLGHLFVTRQQLRFA
jgi:hypothetical protein